MKGLIIDTPHIDNVLSGRKTWEMRSRPTNIRGSIALIRKGSGTVIGVADLVDCLGPLDAHEIASSRSLHMIDEARLADPSVAKWNRAWVLRNARLLRKPVEYRHPFGAVIWVNLDGATAVAISREM